MNVKLNADRLYSLGDYKNIRFTSELTDLPPELISNGAINLLRYWQLLDLEISFNKYLNLIRKVNELSKEDVLAFLEEERQQNLNDLKDVIFKNGKGE